MASNQLQLYIGWQPENQLSFGYDYFKQEIKPPKKLVILVNYYDRERWPNGVHHFYCLPEEVKTLKEKAIAEAKKPFQEKKVINFTKPSKDPIGRFLQQINPQPANKASETQFQLIVDEIEDVDKATEAGFPPD